MNTKIYFMFWRLGLKQSVSQIAHIWGVFLDGI